MASSPFVNTFLVDFASVLAMEHTCMVHMFKFLEDIGLRAGTIISTVCNCKLAVTEDIFLETFKLPTKGITVLADIQKATIVEMQHRFSATEVPFKISGNTREMHFEYRLLHDIVAKSICAKAGSFYSVTCENFDFMTAISARISVNWGRILFQRLLGMVQNSKKQSWGYTVPISIMLTTLVQADLRESVKLHSKNVLKSRSVQAYIKQNQDIIPEGEPSTRGEDTASNPETRFPHQETPLETESLVVVKETVVNKPEKRKHKDGGKKNRTNKVTSWKHKLLKTKRLRKEDPLLQRILILKKCLNQTHDLNFDARKEHEEQQDQDFTADERENSGHNAQMGDNDKIANPGCGTQLESVNPIANDSGAIQNEPVPVE
ncbi:hypothetical protein F511_10531 [Dorcoceras hygrometricum]|uniref:Uncharacterized protein n=1 Tax=Dorcoceras hygrometricum TaxID=472368 RepID=A0A2Z7CXW9_9LAMI|nr:hypothetical protein F511_10531 [Dorcoceras hygrometricum]